MTEAERQARHYKRALKQLTRAVTDFLGSLDVVMEGPSTPERGRRIGLLSNALDMANDSVMHSTLGVSFPAINRRKATAEARARREGRA